MSGFGVMAQSLTTVTGLLVSQMNMEERKIVWSWPMEVKYTCPYLRLFNLFGIKLVEV